MSRSIPWLVTVGLLSAPALALAQIPTLDAPAYPPYPAVRNVATVGQWVRTQTDVPPTTVVGIGQDSLFSVEPGRDPTAAPNVRVRVRQEAIDPDFTRRLGGRSAVMTIDVDCSGRRVFQRALALYAGSNRKGQVRQLGAGTDWRPVPEGSYMDAVLGAVCDPGHRPLYTADARGAPGVPATAPAAPLAPVSSPAVFPSPAPVAAPAPVPAPVFRRVEYGRFASVAAALQAAQGLDAAFPELMAGKQRRLEVSSPDGRAEFRGLIEGFPTPADAAAFCARLQAAGRACAGAG
jgi:hypothetical protein